MKNIETVFMESPVDFFFVGRFIAFEIELIYTFSMSHACEFNLFGKQ